MRRVAEIWSRCRRYWFAQEKSKKAGQNNASPDDCGRTARYARQHSGCKLDIVNVGMAHHFVQPTMRHYLHCILTGPSDGNGCRMARRWTGCGRLPVCGMLGW